MFTNCFSYSLDFIINPLTGLLEFNQTINYSNDSVEVLNGQWTINNQGICLDYTSEEYEDECKYIITHDVDINPKKIKFRTYTKN